MNALHRRKLVVLDSPLTPDEWAERDDHAINIWRLIIETCASTARMAVPRRASASKSYDDDDDDDHDDMFTGSALHPKPRPARVCIFTSEVDPHCFTGTPKTSCLVVDECELPCPKQSMAGKLLRLVQRKRASATTWRSANTSSSSSSSSYDSTVSLSEESVSVEDIPSDSDSLAEYASHELSAWKKVQSYVLKKDKGAIKELSVAHQKPRSPPSPQSKKRLYPAWKQARNLFFSRNRDPDVKDDKIVGSEGDHSKSLDEYFTETGETHDVQNSLYDSITVLQTSAHPVLSTPPRNDHADDKFGVVSNLSSVELSSTGSMRKQSDEIQSNKEKEDIESEFDPSTIPKKAPKRGKGIFSKAKRSSLLSSLLSLYWNSKSNK